MPEAVPDPSGLFLAGISSSCAEVDGGQPACHWRLPEENDSGFIHPLTRKDDRRKRGREKNQVRVCVCNLTQGFFSLHYKEVL